MLTAPSIHGHVWFWPHSPLSNKAGLRKASSRAVFQTSPSPGGCCCDCNLSLNSIFECECIFVHREGKAFLDAHVFPYKCPDTLQRN